MHVTIDGPGGGNDPSNFISEFTNLLGKKYISAWVSFVYSWSVSTIVTFNFLAPEFGIYILANPVCKMWIIQEPKKVALWNKRHFEEKKP